MRNTLFDLNNHLFEQLERLNDEELTKEALDIEVKRAKAMAQVATQITENNRLALDVVKYQREEGMDRVTIPEPLRIDQK